MKGTLHGGSVKTGLRSKTRAEAVVKRRDTATKARIDLEASEAIMNESRDCSHRRLATEQIREWMEYNRTFGARSMEVDFIHHLHGHAHCRGTTIKDTSAEPGRFIHGEDEEAQY